MPNRRRINEKLVKEITSLLAEGKYSITEICNIVGISRRSYYKWSNENAQFTLSIEKAKSKLLLNGQDKMSIESRNALIKLIKGFDITTVKETTRHLKNGKTRTTITYTTRHITPKTSSIVFVLNNIHSANFKSRAKHIVNTTIKNINSEVKKYGRILSEQEAKDLSLASGFETFNQEQVNEVQVSNELQTTSD